MIEPNNGFFIIPKNTVTASESLGDEDETDLTDHFMYVFCIYLLIFIFNPFITLKSGICFAISFEGNV